MQVAVRFLNVAAHSLALFRAAAGPQAATLTFFAPLLARLIARHAAVAHLFAQALAVLPAHAPLGRRHLAHVGAVAMPRTWLGQRRAKREYEQKGNQRFHG